VISGTGRGVLVLLFASHESSFKVPSNCYSMATHRAVGLVVERASHVRKCPRCSEASPQSRGSRSSSAVSGTYMSGERSTYAIFMGHIPRCPCAWYVIQLHSRVVDVLEKFMLEAGGTKGRDLRLEVRHIRSEAPRDRHGDVVWLDFMAPTRHLVDDVTVTSAHTTIRVPRIRARLPPPGSLALGAQQGKLDASFRTSALHGTPSVHLVHDNYPFALEDEGRLVPWRHRWLNAWQFRWQLVTSLA
jgi:hypothetical protein